MSRANRCQGTRRPEICRCLRYFGCSDLSPPGEPGGGITGVLPTSGVGARISGSTPLGGQSTPLPSASRSDNGAESDCPVVTPGRAFGFCSLLGAQSLPAFGWLCVAVGGGGVAGVAGAWARTIA